MKVVVAGGAGFLGRPLCSALVSGRHTPIVLSRNPERAAKRLPSGVQAVAWDPIQGGDWQQVVAESDAVINLSGESLAARRWSPQFKQVLRSSRLDPTRALVAAMRAAQRPGLILLNASAVGYYGDRKDALVTESTPPGSDFLGHLSVDWEAEARAAETFQARVVMMRIGVVLGEGGGMLEKMVPIFRLFLGGPLGSGRQWLPWIHHADVLRMMIWALENASVRGPVNFTAPHPVTMREFATTLGIVMSRAALFPVPAPVLRLAVGEFAQFLLSGQKAIPEKAQRAGFEWKYPALDPALRSLLQK